jgi:hypothetical protein
MNTRLDHICNLIRDRDKNFEELCKLPENAIHKRYGLFHAITILAQENNVEAVEYLLDDFGKKSLSSIKYGDIDYAAKGYAIGCYYESVKDFLRRGAGIRFVVFGYALGGHVTYIEELIANDINLINEAAKGYAQAGYFAEVEDLIRRGASLDQVVQGYAQGGHFDAVQEMLSRGEEKMGSAIRGYALGGYFDMVEKLIAKHPEKLNHALYGYVVGSHINEYLLCYTSNKLLREKLANKARLTQYLEFAAKAHPLIRYHDMTLEEALSYLEYGVSFAVTGQQVMRQDHRMLPEIFQLLGAYVYHTTPKSFSKIAHIANERVFGMNKSENPYLFFKSDADALLKKRASQASLEVKKNSL